jgi:hypothetical protein
MEFGRLIKMKKLFVIFLAVALCGCLGPQKAADEGLVITSEPSPLEAKLEHTFTTLNITLTNNNPFEIEVQCFPPDGPSEAFGDYLREDTPLNKTLLARPQIDCKDPDVNYSEGGYVYPMATIKPGASKRFELKVARLSSVQTRDNLTINATAAGTYEMKMRFDVWCSGLSMGCKSGHKDVYMPIKITVLPINGSGLS